ncbi:MAG: B12-binding domain-containing radical SAM protein [Candidatus Helarchaeota archaeon]
MKSSEIIFIHPPRVMHPKVLKFKTFTRSAFTCFPMGLLAIADMCEREGISAKIINYGMEQFFDPEFSLGDLLKHIDFKVCGIDCHWILHSHGAIEMAKIVKKVNPNAKVVLGGYTATYFHDEIIKYYELIDGVIRGEGEVPFVQYAKAITRNQSLDLVPNLTYRDSSQHVKVNPITYVAPTLDNLNFTNIPLIHNGKKYVEENRDIMKIPFNLCIGRGCFFTCPYCGGGRKAQKILSKRNKVVLRSPEKVIDDLQDIFDHYKAVSVFFGHGTYPANFKYWKKLFQLIRREQIDMGADLEIWRPPFPKEMWYEFYRTFDRNYSSISLCPRTTSMRIQQKIRDICDPTFHFSLSQIYDTIKNANRFRTELRLWFTIGFPFQKFSDLLRDYIFTMKLNLKYAKSPRTPITVLNDLVTISLASPAYENPDRFGITLHYNTFRQIAETMKRTKFSLGGWNNIINYNTAHFSSATIRLWNFAFLMSVVPLFFTGFVHEESQKAEMHE